MPPVLIFVQSKERAQELHFEIKNERVSVIHSDLSQAERDAVVQKFVDGKIWILICTELMARGIDFKGVNLVINYDFPTTAISYIHRIGELVFLSLRIQVDVDFSSVLFYFVC